MIFDTHTHYDDDAFSEDRERVLMGLAAAQIGAVTNIGASMQGAKDSLALAQRYPFVYAAVGVHPDHVGELTEENIALLDAMAKEDKVVAIGEIGLDYYWEVSERQTQKYWFGRQLELALSNRLPVVIHSRDAAADTLELVKKYWKASGGTLRGVIHCFSYGPELAREYLQMGFFLGIGGVATFKNGKKLKEVLAEVPLRQIVLETDCPYLAPEPFRGSRNTSALLSYVVTAIAGQKQVTEAEVEQQTWQNALRLYSLLEKNGQLQQHRDSTEAVERGENGSTGKSAKYH